MLFIYNLSPDWARMARCTSVTTVTNAVSRNSDLALSFQSIQQFLTIEWKRRVHQKCKNKQKKNVEAEFMRIFELTRSLWWEVKEGWSSERSLSSLILSRPSDKRIFATPVVQSCVVTLPLQWSILIKISSSSTCRDNCRAMNWKQTRFTTFG